MKGKKILLGVSGSIAAYKSAILVRLLVKAGAEVKVIMTPSAKDFITPLTLATLSKNPVGCNYFNAENGEWNSHVEYGLWADVMVVAPASANTLSKMANGACDNLLIASYLSAKCPVFFAPAMDLEMYQHPSTKENISKLLSFGNRMIAPTDGELASGLFGEGRMEEAEKIVQVLSDFFLNAQPLKGKKALVSAGPTYEAIDPVRFIGNRSSGKMGYAIAEELSRQGAEVVLVSGPTALSHPHAVKVVKVESAAEMKAACMDNYAKMDVVVMAAAVADFKPAQSAEQKIKKKNSELDLSLVPTEDILKAMGEKKTTQFLVGFALESENELSNAKDKLARKNLDMIVMNSIRDNGAGFNHDTNQITVINSKGQEKTFPLKSKKDVAKDLIEIIVSSLKNNDKQCL